ncbi:hypothetical protein KEM52_004872, partial [Ascosphaera acerosa]
VSASGKAECDPAARAACKAGDLGGKHGSVSAGTSRQLYSDLQLSLDADDPANVVNRTLVLRDARGEPVNCGVVMQMAMRLCLDEDGEVVRGVLDRTGA